MDRNSCTEDVAISVVQGIEGFDSLRDAWNRILSGMSRRHFFHLWEWYDSYLHSLATDPAAMVFFLFVKGETPLAIFPLQLSNTTIAGMDFRTLAFAAHDHVPLCDLICHDEALRLPLFQLLGRHLRSHRFCWDLMRLPHLLEDAGAIRLLDCHPVSRVLLREEGPCDVIETSGSYRSFQTALSKNFGRSLTRAGRHLDELPGVQFTCTRYGPELAERLEAFIDVEASGWKGALGSGTAIKLHPELIAFYRRLTDTLSASGKISINTLTTEGHCIAAQFCILLDQTIYVLKIGYDETYKRYAPGNLLLEFLIQRSIEEGTIAEVNLITDAEWHSDWKPKSRPRSNLHLFNTTPVGLAGYALLKSYLLLKKYYRDRLQPLLRSRHNQIPK